MFSFHCTKKVLDRIPGIVEEPLPATTVLGNWYVNIMFERPHALVLVSDETLLPVVIPAAPMKSFVPRFVEQLAYVLHDLDLPTETIKTELEQMLDFRICKTRSPSILGHLNEYVFHFQLMIDHDKCKSLDQICAALGATMINKRDFQNAGNLTRAKFAATSKSGELT